MKTKRAIDMKVRAAFLALLTALVLIPGLKAETRSAMTSVAVRIERHSGVVISSTEALTSSTVPTSSASNPIIASGNTSAHVILTSERPSLSGRGSQTSLGRTEATVFEP